MTATHRPDHGILHDSPSVLFIIDVERFRICLGVSNVSGIALVLDTEGINQSDKMAGRTHHSFDVALDLHLDDDVSRSPPVHSYRSPGRRGHSTASGSPLHILRPTSQLGSLPASLLGGHRILG